MEWRARRASRVAFWIFLFGFFFGDFFFFLNFFFGFFLFWIFFVFVDGYDFLL